MADEPKSDKPKSDERISMPPTLALNTKVEEEFVSPLTAVRGVLEILRDMPALSEQERRRFVETALEECGRLEAAIQELATSVYDAARRAEADGADGEDDQRVSDRLRFVEEIQVAEFDISGMEFTRAGDVNDFFDAVERRIAATGRDWYFLIRAEPCRVWPEAWVAYAHRGKKISVGLSLGTVRLVEVGAEDSRRSDPNIVETRDTGLARIEELKAGRRFRPR